MKNPNLTFQQKVDIVKGIPDNLPDPNIYNPYLTESIHLEMTNETKQAFADLVVHLIENLSNFAPGPFIGVLQTEEQIRKYIQELYGILDPEEAEACKNK